MAVTFLDDATAVEHLITELGRPVGRRGATSGFSHSARGNRRRSPRVNLSTSDFSVELGGEVVSGVDVSLRGIQFRCRTRLVPGSTVMLSLRQRDESPSIALGRVMWAAFERPHVHVEPHYRVGVVFETVDVRIVRNMLQQGSQGTNSRPGVEVVRDRW